MKITYENGWGIYGYPRGSAGPPMKTAIRCALLRNTEIPGLLGVKGSGRDGSSRYTWRVSSGISVAKKFEHQGMKKQDVEGVIEALVRTVGSACGPYAEPGRPDADAGADLHPWGEVRVLLSPGVRRGLPASRCAGHSIS